MKNKIYLILLFPFLISCQKEEANDETQTGLTNLKQTIAYKSLEEVDENLLSLDIFYTDQIDLKKPIVLWVHGGAWTIGDKANSINDKAALFQSNDYLFISVNYRLSPLPFQLNNPDRVKYPDHNNDVADAILWIYNHIAEYGGNPEKIVLLGHSAGAHLVSLTGTNSEFLDQRGLPFSIIKGVVSIDTEGYNVLCQVGDDVDFYINAFGQDSTENLEASPIHNLQQYQSYPPFFIAKPGMAARIEKANQFIAELETISVSVTQVDGSIYSHAEINEAIGLEGESLITSPLMEFIASCFE